MVWSEEFPASFDIGTPGGGHIHFGNDGSMTLYGPDGVTILAKLDPVNGLTVNVGFLVGSFETSSNTGLKRIVMDNALPDRIIFKVPGENAGDGLILVDTGQMYIRTPWSLFGNLAMWLLSPEVGPGGRSQFVLADTDDYLCQFSGPSALSANDALMKIFGDLTARNQALVADGLNVPVTIAAGATFGTANFLWPKALFTSGGSAGPVIPSLAIVSGAGLMINATPFLTSCTAAGGTVRLDLKAGNVGTGATYTVAVKGEQYT